MKYFILCLGIISSNIFADDYKFISSVGSDSNKMDYYLNTNHKFIKKNQNKDGTEYTVWLKFVYPNGYNVEDKQLNYGLFKYKFNVTNHTDCPLQLKMLYKDGFSTNEEHECKYEDIDPNTPLASVEDYLLKNAEKK